VLDPRGRAAKKAKKIARQVIEALMTGDLPDFMRGFVKDIIKDCWWEIFLVSQVWVEWLKQEGKTENLTAMTLDPQETDFLFSNFLQIRKSMSNHDTGGISRNTMDMVWNSIWLPMVRQYGISIWQEDPENLWQRGRPVPSTAGTVRSNFSGGSGGSAQLSSLGQKTNQSSSSSSQRRRERKERKERERHNSMEDIEEEEEEHNLRNAARKVQAGVRMGGNKWEPAADIKDHGDHYELTMEVAGVKTEDINIQILNNVLCVSATRGGDGETKGGGVSILSERQAEESFERKFVLPEAVVADGINANYEHGVLEVEIPKLVGISISIGGAGEKKRKKENKKERKQSTSVSVRESVHEKRSLTRRNSTRIKSNSNTGYEGEVDMGTVARVADAVAKMKNDFGSSVKVPSRPKGDKKSRLTRGDSTRSMVMDAAAPIDWGLAEEDAAVDSPNVSRRKTVRGGESRGSVDSSYKPRPPKSGGSGGAKSAVVDMRQGGGSLASALNAARLAAEAEEGGSGGLDYTQAAALAAQLMAAGQNPAALAAILAQHGGAAASARTSQDMIREHEQAEEDLHSELQSERARKEAKMKARKEAKRKSTMKKEGSMKDKMAEARALAAKEAEQERQTSEAREVIVAIYKKYDPSKVKKVDQIMAKYKGREEVLFKKLREEYAEEEEEEEEESEEESDEEDDDDDEEEDDDDEEEEEESEEESDEESEEEEDSDEDSDEEE
jgi:HSP20 family molecular chaperone IbpA